MKETIGIQRAQQWFSSKGWLWADFQKETAEAYLAGKSGLLNAPTGSGKTYALWVPALIKHIDSEVIAGAPKKGLQVLWITPLRALATDLQRNMQDAATGLGLGWQVGSRSGDTPMKDRAKQKKQMPESLIITPESLHLLFAQKDSSEIFKDLHTVIVDEWHELMGSKRGVQTELAITRLRGLNPKLITWGISATIGNLDQAMQVLMGMGPNAEKGIIIRSANAKEIIVETILPDKIETLPWAGHMGVRLVDLVIPILRASKTTLIFTNTRSQTEIWYRAIIDKYPEFAGLMALHHGSLSKEVRTFVEEALHAGTMKFVICTSTLDLGVDFRPVETVIQVGSPKSVSRFVQRAGRSGHRPGVPSKIYFVPTHSLELIEAVSLRYGVEHNILEERTPVIYAFDVLAQWMVTLAVGEGFSEAQLYEEVKNTFGYQDMLRADWEWLLGYITTGSASLTVYDEFKKAEVVNGFYRVLERKVSQRHLMSMGTIVSDAAIHVKMQNGKYLGTVEEHFITRLNPGDVFWFGGMPMEFIKMKAMTATVRKSNKRTGILTRWGGGRMPLSSILTQFIRERLSDALANPHEERELAKMMPLLELQAYRSIIPASNELLIEQCETDEGHHIFVFPFEGRLVHEGMAVLLGYRISLLQPISFSIAMNDYGFELLSDQYVDMQQLIDGHDLFTTNNLLSDINRSVNATEMARRKFRDVAAISGLMFQGFPGKPIRASQIQSSASLLFNVLTEYEKDNLFIRQAFQEVLEYQLEERRMRIALERITSQKIVVQQTEKPTPFSFPILVDGMREQLTSEKLEDRVQRMIQQYSDAD